MTHTSNKLLITVDTDSSHSDMEMQHEALTRHMDNMETQTDSWTNRDDEINVLNNVIDNQFNKGQVIRLGEHREEFNKKYYLHQV